MRSLLPALLVVVASSTMAAPPKVLFSTLATSDTSVVPGYPTLRYGTTFSRIFASPDGNRFAFMGIATPGTLRCITTGVVGNPGASVTPVIRNQPWPFNASESVQDIRTTMGINNNGELGFAAMNASSGLANEHAIKWDGSTFSLVAREGDPAPLINSTYLSAMAGHHILADGSVAFGSGVNSSANDGGLFAGNALRAQRGVTIPLNQRNGGSEAVSLFELDKFRVGQSGNIWMYEAKLTGPTASDSVVVVNGGVVAQEGFALPDPFNQNPNPVVSFDTTAMSASSVSAENQHYAFRGTLTGGQDFAMYGKLLGFRRFVFEDQPIEFGSTETWSAASGLAFTLVGVNSFGEGILAGYTSNPDTTKNWVVVFFNGYYPKVVLRRGDALDLDGNGLGDDNLFIQQAVSDNVTFTDNNRLFLGATLRNSAGTISGVSLAVLDLPITGDVDGSEEVDAADIDNVIALFGSTTPGIPEDVDGSGEVDAADIDIVIANFGRTR